MARKKKSKIPPFVVKITVIALLAAGVFWAVGRGLTYVFRQTGYFKVRSVVIDPSLQFIDKRDLKSVLGKNIFDVNLKEVQRRLRYKYPQTAQLRVMKQFPNRVAVVAKPRLPFAQLRMADRVVTVDKEGVVLAREEQPDEKLPLITGHGGDTQKVVLGLPLKKPDIRIALQVVKLFQADKSLDAYAINEINITNLSKIYMTLSNRLQVILDRGRLAHKIRVLGVVLAQGTLDPGNIKYVDLRFKEPIIGKK